MVWKFILVVYGLCNSYVIVGLMHDLQVGYIINMNEVVIYHTKYNWTTNFVFNYKSPVIKNII